MPFPINPTQFTVFTSTSTSASSRLPLAISVISASLFISNTILALFPLWVEADPDVGPTPSQRPLSLVGSAPRYSRSRTSPLTARPGTLPACGVGDHCHPAGCCITQVDAGRSGSLKFRTPYHGRMAELVFDVVQEADGGY